MASRHTDFTEKLLPRNNLYLRENGLEATNGSMG